jgi:hypothetical protein
VIIIPRLRQANKVKRPTEVPLPLARSHYDHIAVLITSELSLHDHFLKAADLLERPVSSIAPQFQNEPLRFAKRYW